MRQSPKFPPTGCWEAVAAGSLFFEMRRQEQTFSNGYNSLRKALRVHLHTNFLTYFDV
jgi:hypothetical protein